MIESRTGQNALDNTVVIKGSLSFENDLVFDGTLEGNVESKGSLTVGENADLQAEVRARSVTIRGKVTGNIHATERCELKSRGQLYGDLQTARLIIEEGATFVGKSEVSPDGKFHGERAQAPQRAQRGSGNG